MGGEGLRAEKAESEAGGGTLLKLTFQFQLKYAAHHRRTF